jgi:ankyrin repeat protein
LFIRFLFFLIYFFQLTIMQASSPSRVKDLGEFSASGASILIGFSKFYKQKLSESLNKVNHKGESAIYLASGRADSMELKALIFLGANIDARNNLVDGPLYNALWNKNVENIKILLRAGSNIEAYDHNGQSPVRYALSINSLEILKVLLQAGANTEARCYPNGRTPLFWASSFNHVRIVKALLRAGANVEARDDDGKTPLSCAVSFCHIDNVKALLRAGANIEARDNNGNTVLENCVILSSSSASSSRYMDAAKILISAGARTDFDVAKVFARAKIKTDALDILKINAKINWLLYDLRFVKESDEGRLVEQVIKSAFDSYDKGEPELLAVILGGIVAENSSDEKNTSLWSRLLLYYKKSTKEGRALGGQPSTIVTNRVRGFINPVLLDNSIIPNLKRQIPGLKIETNQEIEQREHDFLERAKNRSQASSDTRIDIK